MQSTPAFLSLPAAHAAVLCAFRCVHCAVWFLYYVPFALFTPMSGRQLINSLAAPAPDPAPGPAPGVNGSHVVQVGDSTMSCLCIVTLHWTNKQQPPGPLRLRALPLPLPLHSQQLLLGGTVALPGSLSKAGKEVAPKRSL